MGVDVCVFRNSANYANEDNVIGIERQTGETLFGDDRAFNWDNEGTESAGLNRHIVGDARALRERRSDSILASSLALLPARVAVEA